MFTNHTSNEWLVSGLENELSKLNNKKSDYPIKRWGRELSRDFTKEDIQVADSHITRSMSLIIGKCKLKWDTITCLFECLTLPPPQTHTHTPKRHKKWPCQCWWGCLKLETIWKTVWPFLCNHMDESQNNYAGRRKCNKKYTLCDSINVKFQKV